MSTLSTTGTVTASTLLRQEILSGNFTPGQRIPPERELAVRFGLSRSSIREAIKGLVSLNILETKRGSGTYVRSLDSSEMFEALEFVLDVDPESLSHFFELRRLLEPAAAGLAAARLSDQQRSDLADVRAELASLEVTAQDVGRLIELDDIVHDMISLSTGNPLIHSLVKSLRSTARQSQQLLSAYTIDDIARAKVELTSLIDALIEENSLRAQGIMMWHLESSMVGWKQGSPAVQSEAHYPR
jgi:GntR family transcriptional repressor for pyruvate dehydrogenase complex